MVFNLKLIVANRTPGRAKAVAMFAPMATLYFKGFFWSIPRMIDTLSLSFSSSAPSSQSCLESKG